MLCPRRTLRERHEVGTTWNLQIRVTALSQDVTGVPRHQRHPREKITRTEKLGLAADLLGLGWGVQTQRDKHTDGASQNLDRCSFCTVVVHCRAAPPAPARSLWLCPGSRGGRTPAPARAGRTRAGSAGHANPRQPGWPHRHLIGLYPTLPWPTAPARPETAATAAWSRR